MYKRNRHQSIFHTTYERHKTSHQDWSGIEQGWIYGEWETGPWWGFRTKGKEAGKYGLVGSIFGLQYDFDGGSQEKKCERSKIAICRWVGLGEGMRSDHMVWRHTCNIIDFKAILISNVVNIIIFVSSRKNLLMFGVTLL